MNDQYRVLITGASSGIGAALYIYFREIFKERGCGEVVGVSRNGPDVFLDITKPIPCYENPVNVLINCAGAMPMPDSPSCFDVNFWGTVDMINAVLPVMRDQGCIINIASVSGLRADPELPFYAASKAAIISYTQSLAKQLAPSVRVNCVSPGFHKTNLVFGDTPQELIDTIPLGYENEASGLIHIIQGIINTPYMTGANIVVDGGVSL